MPAGSRLVSGLLLLAALSLTTCAGDPAGPAEEDFAVLFIGNSLTYTNDLPTILADLLTKESDLGDVVVEDVANPNYGLQDHWGDGEVLDRIRNGSWDVIILQQGPSATEGRPSLIEYSTLFNEPIRASGATPALYMVWPEKARTFDFAGVRDSYRTAADSVDGYFFPAGAAWQEAWALDADLGLYDSDNFHPTPYGSYLAAVVIYEQLSGRSALDLPMADYGPFSVPADIAETLHAAAHAANVKYARTPAIE